MNRAIVIHYYGEELTKKQLAELALIVSQAVRHEDADKTSIAVFDAKDINTAILNCAPVVQKKDETEELVNLMKVRLGYTDSKPAITYVYALLDKANSDGSFLHEFTDVYRALAKAGESQFVNIAKKCNVKKHFVETIYSVGNRIFSNV